MEQVILDPRTKAAIKDALVEFLYEPVERSMKRRMDEIIIANTLAGKYSCKSFHYKGQQYHCEDGRPPRAWNKLLPQFKERVDEWLADFRQIEEQERPFVFGFINQVLNSSNHLVDYYELFPDSAHQPIKALAIDTSLMYQYSLMPQDKKDALLLKNAGAIQTMKTRMVTNLLL